MELKLCLASPELYPPCGGAELRFLRYLAGFKQRGVTSFGISGTPPAHKIIYDKSTDEWLRTPIGGILTPTQVDGVPVHRVRLPEKNGTKRSELFLQVLLKFCNDEDYRPDVIQILSYLSPGALPYLSRLRTTGIPIVYAYTLPKIFPRNPIKRIFKIRSLRKVYETAQCIVTSSSATRKILLDMKVKTRIISILNGVDLKRFTPAKDIEEKNRIKQSLGLSPKSKVILNIGAIDPRKGIDLLLEAWKRLAVQRHDIHLFLVGMRHDLNNPQLKKFRSKIENLLNCSDGADCVHFAGYVNNAEEYLRAADVFVFPSMREGMGNAVTEAMASGVPVILTPFVGLPQEFGKPGEHFIKVERDPDALSAAIGTLLDDSDFCRELIASGLKLVRDTMDIEMSLDKYVALYRDLVQKDSQDI